MHPFVGMFGMLEFETDKVLLIIPLSAASLRKIGYSFFARLC